MFANKFEMREKLVLRFRRTKCGLTIIMYSKALDVDNLDEFRQVTWSHFLPEGSYYIHRLHDHNKTKWAIKIDYQERY